MPPQTHINRAMFDRFTLVHAATGAVLGRLGAPWWVALGVSVVWELAEPTLKRTRPYRDWFPVPSQDSLANTVGDTAGLMSGWYLGSR